MAEQDDASPHKYFTESFKPEADDVFVDIGSAEGLEVVNLLGTPKKMYLFEGDSSYKKPLELTFADEMKSGYVNLTFKFAGMKKDKDYVCIDEIVKPSKNICIKMDVEGSEIDVLNCAENLITKSEHVKLAIACYHYKESADELLQYLTKRGYKCSFTDGFVIFNYDPLLYENFFADIKSQRPYFRKGVIRAEK